MARYRLTNKAEADIDDIYVYSVMTFGFRTARAYLEGLHSRFDLLADNHSWGNDYGFIAPGLLRYEHRSHSIYYIADDTGRGIVIVRVLGAGQDPARHF